MTTQAEAYKIGAEWGRNAAAWYFDGDTTDDTYRRVVQGFDDGDPEVLDTLPTFAFGEWSGESRSEIFWDWDDMTPEEQDDVTDAFLDGYSEAGYETIESDARRALGI